jgi:hypothetical protein
VRAALRVPRRRVAVAVVVGSGRHGAGTPPWGVWMGAWGSRGMALDFWSLLGHLGGAAVEVRAEEEGKVWRGECGVSGRASPEVRA